MLKQTIIDDLKYNPKTGALSWRDTGLPATTRGKHGHYVYVCGQVYYAARVAWLIAKGDWPTRIKFLNGDKFDMRMDNMRELTPADQRWLRRQEQVAERRKLDRVRAKLPVGVYQCRDSNLYYARILVAGRIKVSPRVDTPAEAKALRDALKLNRQTT